MEWLRSHLFGCDELCDVNVGYVERYEYVVFNLRDFNLKQVKVQSFTNAWILDIRIITTDTLQLYIRNLHCHGQMRAFDLHNMQTT